MSEQAAEATTAEPSGTGDVVDVEWTEGGNIAGEDPSITAAMARAMDEAEAELLEQPPPDPPPDDDPPAADPTPAADPPPAGDDPPPDDPDPAPEPEPRKSKAERMWEKRDERRRVRELEGQLAQLQEQIANQQRQPPSAPDLPPGALEGLKVFASGQTARGVAMIAKATGKTADQVYLDLTQHQLNPDAATQQEAQQLDPKQMIEQAQAAAREEFRRQTEALEQRQQQAFLQRRTHEVANVGKSEMLSKHFPYLGSLSPAKLHVEAQNSVRDAFDDPEMRGLLNDELGFVEKLNEIAQAEFEHQLARLVRLDPEGLTRILSANGYGLSAKPDGNGNPSKPDGSQPRLPSAANGRSTTPRTLTSADTQTDGATREPTEEEKDAQLAALFSD